MNSGNHVMLLGDLLTWCYQYLAGIRQTAESTAYKHIVLRPSFGIEDCFSIDASYETPYGTVKSQWHKTLERLHWDVEIRKHDGGGVAPRRKSEERGQRKPTLSTALFHIRTLRFCAMSFSMSMPRSIRPMPLPSPN